MAAERDTKAAAGAVNHGASSSSGGRGGGHASGLGASERIRPVLPGGVDLLSASEGGISRDNLQRLSDNAAAYASPALFGLAGTALGAGAQVGRTGRPCGGITACCTAAAHTSACCLAPLRLTLGAGLRFCVAAGPPLHPTGCVRAIGSPSVAGRRRQSGSSARRPGDPRVDDRPPSCAGAARGAGGDRAPCRVGHRAASWR